MATQTMQTGPATRDEEHDEQEEPQDRQKLQLGLPWRDGPRSAQRLRAVRALGLWVSLAWVALVLALLVGAGSALAAFGQVYALFVLGFLVTVLRTARWSALAGIFAGSMVWAFVSAGAALLLLPGAGSGAVLELVTTGLGQGVLTLVPVIVAVLVAPGRLRGFAISDWLLLGLAVGLGFQAAEQLVRSVWLGTSTTMIPADIRVWTLLVTGAIGFAIVGWRRAGAGRMRGVGAVLLRAVSLVAPMLVWWLTVLAPLGDVDAETSAAVPAWLRLGEQVVTTVPLDAVLLGLALAMLLAALLVDARHLLAVDEQRNDLTILPAPWRAAEWTETWAARVSREPIRRRMYLQDPAPTAGVAGPAPTAGVAGPAPTAGVAGPAPTAGVAGSAAVTGSNPASPATADSAASGTTTPDRSPPGSAGSGSTTSGPATSGWTTSGSATPGSAGADPKLASPPAPAPTSPIAAPVPPSAQNPTTSQPGTPAANPSPTSADPTSGIPSASPSTASNTPAETPAPASADSPTAQATAATTAAEDEAERERGRHRAALNASRGAGLRTFALETWAVTSWACARVWRTLVVAVCALVAYATRDKIVILAAHAGVTGESRLTRLVRGRAAMEMTRHARQEAYTRRSGTTGRTQVIVWRVSAGLLLVLLLTALWFAYSAVQDDTPATELVWLTGYLNGLAPWWSGLSVGDQVVIAGGIVALVLLAGGSLGTAFGVSGAAAFLSSHGYGVGTFVLDPRAAVGSYLRTATPAAVLADGAELALTFTPVTFGGAVQARRVRLTCENYLHAFELGGDGVPTKAAAFAEFAARAIPPAGYHDVVIQADFSSAASSFSPKRVAKLILNNADYAGGPVRLVPGAAGGTPDEAAQALADRLGVQVLAPNNTVHAFDSGRLVVGPSPLVPTGEWVTFEPGAQR
ncbi:hypothetical protein [Kineosporia babensis]|uniref:Uncharacterized protein n=1 Tax=Kineosporia babensis TaxID=499548 RepID=A0A9X1NBU6_9ACTN|nr:hypothetical protein [Kineosporia babensis]MCD5310964.1 hypothetical protein [Kineosporia babensis]